MTDLHGVSRDHHQRLIRSLTTAEQLDRLKRFTTDFAEDPTQVTDEQYEFLYQRGFLPEKTELYSFEQHDADLYLDDVQRWLTRYINGEFATVFNNKVLFTQVFRNFAKVPPITAIWRSGRMIPYDDLWEKIKREGLDEPRKFVAKPLGGGGGGNVYFMQVGKKSVVIESNEADEKRRTLPVSEIERMFDGQRVPFMVTEFIYQGEFASNLYPLTVNTVRMLVIRDPETLKPYVVRAVQRIGTSASYPIDNFSMGGLSADIDLESGLMGPAVAAAGPFKGKGMTHHPDTGEPIAGVRVPNWDSIMERVQELFLQIPYVQYSGFDLIIEDDDFVVLEGNSFSQVRLFQMHRPLLTDVKYRKFLAHYGIYHAQNEGSNE